MVELVHEHKPDVFLISGDVYHTSQPSAAVQIQVNQQGNASYCTIAIIG